MYVLFRLILARTVLFSLCCSAKDYSETWTQNEGGYEKSSVTILAHFNARDNFNVEYCRIYLKLVNAISITAKPRSNETLLIFSFRTQNDAEITKVFVSNSTNPIDEYSREGKYSHLMLKPDSTAYHKLQLLSYKIYESFSAIEMYLVTFPSKPKLRIINFDNEAFCFHKPQRLNDRSKRLKNYITHYSITPELMLAKFFGIGTAQFCVFVFSNWHLNVANVVVNISDGSRFFDIQLLKRRQLLTLLVELPTRTKSVTNYNWTAIVTFHNSHNDQINKLLIEVYEEAKNESIIVTLKETSQVNGNVNIKSIEGWISVIDDISLKRTTFFPGGSISLFLPSNITETEYVLTIANIPKELGNFSLNQHIRNKYSTFPNKTYGMCVFSNVNVVCILPAEEKFLLLQTSKADVEFLLSNRTTLRSATSSHVHAANYRKKVLVTNTEIDSASDSDTYSYECPLSENDFDRVDYDGFTLASRVVKTGQGSEGTVVVEHKECNRYCQQPRHNFNSNDEIVRRNCTNACRENLGVICVGTFGH